MNKTPEDELKNNEEKYRTLFENMAQGVFYQLSDYSISDVNSAALEMLGLSRSEFLGRTSFNPEWKVVDESYKILAAEKHPSMIALLTGKPVTDYLTGVYNPKTKLYSWLIVNAFPQFRNGDIKPYQVFVTLHDNTQRRADEIKLRIREERFRQISESISDISFSCIVNTKGESTIEWLYGASEIVTGYTLEEIKAMKSWEKLVAKEDYPLFRKHILSAIPGKSDNCELKLRHKNGDIVWVYATSKCTAIENDAERFFIYGALVNITPVKKAQTELEERNNNLEFVTRLGLRLAEMDPEADLQQFLTRQLRKYTGAAIAVFTEYIPDEAVLSIHKVEGISNLNHELKKITEYHVLNSKFPVSNEIYRHITTEAIVKRYTSLTDISFGIMPEELSSKIIKQTGIGIFYGITFMISGELFGTAVIGFRADMREPSKNLLESFAHLAAMSLRRKKAEESLKLKIDELEKFNDLTVGRELKMIELKLEINQLLIRLGENEKYKFEA